MSVSQFRRVRRLQLRSSNDSLPRRGAIILDDALRTASLPDAGGSRLLLVRSVSLGRFRADASPASVALLLERKVHELSESAVSADDASAPFAPAVYFHDEVSPLIKLAIRVARKQSADEWFWPLAARHWRQAMGMEEALGVLLKAVCRTEAGWGSVLLLVRTMFWQDALRPLLSSLMHSDGAALLGVFGWTAPPARQGLNVRLDLAYVDQLPQSFAVLARPWFVSWGADDARSLWLAAVMQMVRRTEIIQPLASATAMSQARLWIDCILSPPLPGLRDDDPFMIEAHSVDSQLAVLQGGGLSVTEVNSALLHLQSPAVAMHLQDRRCGEIEPLDSPGSDEPVNHRSESTHHGGLFFLLRAMERTGLPEWLDDQPGLADCNFPSRLLYAIGSRVEAPAGDAVMRALAISEEKIPAPVQGALAQWTLQLRRWCRLNARIGLYSVVCRPALIAFTETHIDVSFRSQWADIRVRKAGLDIDPGWLPWFGRVVHFHYLSREQFDGS